MANSVDKNERAPKRALSSLSILFAFKTYLKGYVFYTYDYAIYLMLIDLINIQSRRSHIKKFRRLRVKHLLWFTLYHNNTCIKRLYTVKPLNNGP